MGKSLGVVAPVHFDLRERGLIGDKIALCGTNGNKFDQIRNHFKEKIVFSNLPNLEFEQFPQTGEANPKAYLEALDKFAKAGDVCSVFTPDDSHFEIISAALDRGLHVMATKPMNTSFLWRRPRPRMCCCRLRCTRGLIQSTV